VAYLEQMILHDVANDAELVEVAAASLGAEGLLERERHAGDGVAAPQLLEEAVGEAQHDYVLDHFFAQVVVDAVDLGLGEEGGDVLGEGVGRVQVLAKGLLHDHARKLGSSE